MGRAKGGAGLWKARPAVEQSKKIGLNWQHTRKLVEDTADHLKGHL